MATEQASHPSDLDQAHILIRQISSFLPEGPPEYPLQLTAVIEVMLSFGIHIPKNVLKAPEGESEGQDPRLGPVDDSRDIPCVRVDEDVHLAEVLVAENKGETPREERWERFTDPV